MWRRSKSFTPQSLPVDLTLTPCFSSNRFTSGVAVNQFFSWIAVCGTTGCLISVTHAVKRGGNGLWSKLGFIFSSTEPSSSTTRLPTISFRNRYTTGSKVPQLSITPSSSLDIFHLFPIKLISSSWMTYTVRYENELRSKSSYSAPHKGDYRII